MTREYEPDARDLLYEELRHRIVHKQYRTRQETSGGAIRHMRSRVTRASDLTGSALGSRLLQLLAAGLALIFAAVLVFLLIQPREAPVPPPSMTPSSTSAVLPGN